jgi:hypothetical protein
MRAPNWIMLPAVAVLGLVLQSAPEAPFGVLLIKDAHAVVGVPWSPASVAGVARRTTRRAVVVGSTAAASTSASSQQQATAEQQAATAQQQAAVAQQQAEVAQQQATVAAQQAGAPPIGSTVSTLPQGCVSAPKDNVQYFNCSGVFYRVAFQGNNLVYVVTQP